jgi:multicomponent Na+:H+ antiporter subunit G
MFTGTVVRVLAAVGIVRMPDLYTRMQAATKATTLGVACSVLAVAVWFPGWGVLARAVLILVFVALTTPVSAHILGRMAYLTGVPLWKGTVVDELERDLREKYQRKAG